MAIQTVKIPSPPEPAFLSYLLDQSKKHDCYFLVGNKQQGLQKRIGVVKKMLMAHSVVLRTGLEESKLAEKGDVPAEDIYLDTFINLLKNVYGYDNTPSLSFDEADDLLYAAEKYDMTSVKARVSTRLMSMLTTDNVCTLLNNPACYTTLELKSSITHILQYETSRVLANPTFLDISPEGFVKILEQEAMDIAEIDIWRAALKWAKHKVESDDGQVLRKQLSKPMKLIRICTLSLEEFAEEVMPKNILSYAEVTMVILYHGTKQKQTELMEFSNEIKSRDKTNQVDKMRIKSIETCSDQIVEMRFDYIDTFLSYCNGNFTLLTKKLGVELLPWEFTAKAHTLTMVPEDLTYEFPCTITITEITDYETNTSTKTPVTVRFRQQVKYGSEFVVPITSNGQNVCLLPNKKYIIEVSSHQLYTCYRCKPSPYTQEHLSLSLLPYNSNTDYYFSPIKRLLYRPVDMKSDNVSPE